MSSSQSSGRTSKGFALILGAARAAGLSARTGSSLLRKAESDELVFVALNDPVMAAAIGKARQTLARFLNRAKNPGPMMGGFAVKITIASSEGAEFIWIHPFAHVGERFIGQIKNTPRSVAGLTIGSTVAFDRTEIVDWMYIEAGVINGNFTARAIVRAARPHNREAFKRRFGLDFDF